ncbi:MAG: TonB-dependent receptor [Deltaproteobacteria bacterium]|nr:TonB-dependent receptor [Deltaproteobacteria bacterium]
MLRKSLCFIALFILASSAFAEEKNVTRLEDIVVTATRTEKMIETAPGSVNVVTKKETELRNVKTVDSALNALPGVFNRRQSLMDTLSAVSLRGIPEQKRTLIIQDGLQLNSAYDGGVAYTGIPLESIERIEVVQGPFSSLYGGYAMGGVVNVITRMPDQREFTLKSGYGSSWNRGESFDDLQRYYISYGDKLTEKFRLLVNYAYEETNGFPKYLNVQSSMPTAGITGWSATTTNQGAARYIIGDKGNNTWRDDNVNLKARYDFTATTKLSASFSTSRYKYNYEEPHTYLRDASGNPVYTYGSVRESSFNSGLGSKEIDRYNLKLETEFSDVKTQISFGLNHQRKSWYTTSGTTAATTLTGGPGKLSSSPNQNYNLDLQLTMPLLTRHILTFGGSYKLDRANAEEFDLTNWTDETTTTSLTYNAGGKNETYALFAQDEIMIRGNLTAYVGFRQDWWKTFDGYANQFGTGAFADTYDSRNDSSFSPKVSLVYKPFAATTLRTSWGQAFRAPTVYELYRKWISSTGRVYNGNPDLKPETVTAWDVGVTQGLWKGAKFSVTYFENRLKDLIYRKTVSSTQSDYVNAGKARSKGVVLDLEQRFDQWLRLFANFTYTDARIRENSAKTATVDKRLTYLPKKLFNVGAEFEKGRLAASITGRYVDKRYSNDENTDEVDDVFTSYDAFFTAEAKVSCKILDNAKISLAVDNLFDESHFEYYQAPGRLWFAQVELKF